MNKTGIGIDYSNICKDYNTAYLDRDNKDPETSRCMKQVVEWTSTFLSDLSAQFGYEIFHLNTDVPVRIDEVASNRFLFYSLEKEITLQSYVMQKAPAVYANAAGWAAQSREGVLIQNDEDGEGIYFYFEEGSDVQQWILEQLQDFALDEVPFPAN